MKKISFIIASCFITLGITQASPQVKSADISDTLSQKYQNNTEQTERSLASSPKSDSSHHETDSPQRVPAQDHHDFKQRDIPRLQYWNY